METAAHAAQTVHRVRPVHNVHHTFSGKKAVVTDGWLLCTHRARVSLATLMKTTEDEKMANADFNLDNWYEFFSNAEHQSKYFQFCEGGPYSPAISGPGSAVVSIRIREKVWPDLNPAAGIPTDIFVLGLGEPEDPRGTKIGGMPYLPKSIKWPTLSDGKPKEFIAQFNLADSREHLPNLPGDMLLIFCEACGAYALNARSKRARGEAVDDPPKPEGPVKYYLMDETWEFLFIDSTAHPADTLYTRDEAPDSPFYLDSIHGQRLRSSDHPDLVEAYEEAQEDGAKFTSVPGVLNATKLGGHPAWDQGGSFSSWAPLIGQPGGPVFIGQLNSDNSPKDDPRERNARRLTIADLGSLYLFWDGEKILYEVQGG